MKGQRFAMCVWAAVLVLAVFGQAAEENTETGEVEAEKARIYVGAGAVVSTKPYIGVDSKIYPIPVFGYEGERLYLRGIVGGYRLIKSQRFSFGPVLRPRFEGYEEDDSSALDGMGDRRPTLDAGLEVSYRADWGLLSLEAVTDVLGEYDGQELEFAYTARFDWAGFTFVPSAALRWRSSDLVGYYYGVEPSEALPGRPAYNPDDAFSPAVRLAVARELSERWGTLLGIQYEWLDSEMRNSPIVDEHASLSLLLSLAYSF
jgi:outer membrane protein